jgi:hypothetical protein
MPVEFRCSQCGKLLRTGDDTVGRQAQCPECGSLTTVPGPGETTGAPPPLEPLGPAVPASSGNPFGPTPGATSPTGSDNPYQSPGTYAYAAPLGQPDPMAAQRVSGPATALIVMAILSMCFQVLGIIAHLVGMVIGVGAAARHPDEFPMMFGSGINVVFGVFGLAISALVLIGATKMKKLENYSLAMAAAIVAVIPCISPCCLLGLPFGIWALVVLNDASVKAAFRS